MYQENELVVVAIEELNIDSRYQRNQIKATINDISKNMEPRAFGAPLVSKRPDGTLWVIDGQQRIEALRARGDKTVRVFLVSVNTRAEEAALFGLVNTGRRMPNAIERYRAAVVAGEYPDASVDKWLNLQGIRVGRGSHGKDSIDFIGAVLRAWSQDEEAAQKAILFQSRIGGGRLTGDVFGGIFLLMKRGVTLDKHCEKIIKMGGVDEIRGRGVVIRKSLTSNSATAVAHAIIAMINHGKRTQRIRFPEKYGTMVG